MKQYILLLGQITVDYDEQEEVLGCCIYIDGYTSDLYQFESITKSQLITMRDNLNSIIWSLEPQDDTKRSDT